jgi:hypothetical protein
MIDKGKATINISNSMKDWSDNLSFADTVNRIHQFKKFARLWTARVGYSSVDFRLVAAYNDLNIKSHANTAESVEKRLRAAILQDFNSQLNAGLPMELWPSLTQPRIWKI